MSSLQGLTLMNREGFASLGENFFFDGRSHFGRMFSPRQADIGPIHKKCEGHGVPIFFQQETFPASCRNDILLTSTRRHCVASTSVCCKKKLFCVITQGAHDVDMTSYCRRCDVITSMRRHFDVMCVLGNC